MNIIIIKLLIILSKIIQMKAQSPFNTIEQWNTNYQHIPNSILRSNQSKEPRIDNNEVSTTQIEMISPYSTYPIIFFLTIFVLIALIALYFLKNSKSLLTQCLYSLSFPHHHCQGFQTKNKSRPIILPACPPQSDSKKDKDKDNSNSQSKDNKGKDKEPTKDKDNEAFHTPNKSVVTHIEEESFGEIKINNFQDVEGSPLRQNFLKKGAGNIDKDKNSEEKTEKALIEKLKQSLMNNQLGTKANDNLHQYFFTRNSENESNPNYSKKCSTDDMNMEGTGRSLTHVNVYDNKRTKDMLRYIDYDEDSEKRGLANFNSKIYKRGLAIRDAVSNDSQSKAFSVQHEISVSIENPDKEEEELIYNSFKAQGQAQGKTKGKAKAKLVNIKSNQPNSLNILDNNNNAKDKSLNEDNEEEKATITKVSFCRTYYNYSKRRDLFLITFFAKKSYLPFFIKFPIFLFCLTVVFTIHSLLYSNAVLHDRYTQQFITGAFWFEKEFGRCLYTALLCNVIKMVIIKVLIFYVFRIEKKILSRDNYKVILERLRCKAVTVFIVMLVIMFVLFYINTCYCGIFTNTQGDFFIGYVVTLLFTFIFAMIICLLINVIGLIGVKCNFACLQSTFNCLKIVY